MLLNSFRGKLAHGNAASSLQLYRNFLAGCDRENKHGKTENILRVQLPC
jgi:hypothetical protein